VSDGGPKSRGRVTEGVSKMKAAGLALFFLLVALLVQEQEARMMGGGGGRRRYNHYGRRPWEAGYIGQYGSGRRYWESDAWRRGGRHHGGLSVSQGDDWRPPAWDTPEVAEMEPDYEQEEEEECDWMCTQERMQELAREQEQLQEERRVREQQRREEERAPPASQREAAAVVADDHQVPEAEVPELYPDWSWDSEGNRRMWEWRQMQEERQRQEREERERKPDEDSSSCTGMCRIMRMRTGK